MNVDRLNHLITVLQNIKARNLPFDLNEWANAEGDEEDHENGEHACGTTACACGYAGLDSTFQAAGFKLQLSKFSSDEGGMIHYFPSNVTEFNEKIREGYTSAYPVLFDNSKVSEHNWDAVSAFFEVTDSVAQALFMDTYSDEEQEIEEKKEADQSPDTVIERIDALMQLGETKFVNKRRNGEIK